MPIPPILDIFVVWHPGDAAGLGIYEQLQDHFHSPAFSGLVGGAVEVYPRSEPWDVAGAPRPLGIREELAPGVPSAQFHAIVPVVGVSMMRAANDSGGWSEYLDEIGGYFGQERVGVYPIKLAGGRVDGSLASSIGQFQLLPDSARNSASLLGRELSQAIAQHLRRCAGEEVRLAVFVSHTKRKDPFGPGAPQTFYEAVRSQVQGTRLATFFDAYDIQSGDDWETELLSHAGRNALLIVRTDRYAERQWTQREVKAAKEHDMPIVTMYALQDGEERGSFLMDHVPSVVCDLNDPTVGVDAALNALVTEALKSALWRAQGSYIEADGFDWLPSRSPEPTTLAPWLARHRLEHPGDDVIWVMHPDPPLGPAEREVIVQMCTLAGYSDGVHIFTPRTFAARGGTVDG